MPKILIDENLPIRLAREFSTKLEVSTIRDEGWTNKKNGELLKLMKERNFDFLLNADQNIEYQQNLDTLTVRLVIVQTYNNSLSTIRPFIHEIEEHMLKAAAGIQVIRIDIRNR